MTHPEITSPELRQLLAHAIVDIRKNYEKQNQDDIILGAVEFAAQLERKQHRQTDTERGLKHENALRQITALLDGKPPTPVTAVIREIARDALRETA